MTAYPAGNVERLFNEGTLPRGVCRVKETNDKGTSGGGLLALGRLQGRDG